MKRFTMGILKRSTMGILVLAMLLVGVFFASAIKTEAQGTLTTVDVSYNIDFVSKEDMLNRINEIRLEFYNENNIYHYVDNYEYTPIKWSSDLEEIAMVRAAEASFVFSHSRPNGLPMPASSAGLISHGEIIASPPNALSAINLWYSEKADYVAQMSGDTSNQGVTGHYTALIFPEYIGIASFGVTAGEVSSLPGTSERQIASPGQKTMTIEIGSEDAELRIYSVNESRLAELPETFTLGTSDTQPMKAILIGDWSRIEADGTWSSDAPEIASVDKDGNIKGISQGTANITFQAGTFTKSFMVSVCDYKNEWRDGKWYNADGTQTYEPVLLWYFDQYGLFVRDTSGWYPSDQWQKIDGKMYYFDAAGYMQTGWVWDGVWYYINPDGTMAEGWTFDGWNWYYMDESGIMQTGWMKDDGNWYYLNPDGTMATGWVNDGISWYHMSDAGTMQTGWVFDGGWYYLGDDGTMAHGWVKDHDRWYYMGGSGMMQTGWIWDGAWYYMGADGAMADGWVSDGLNWYYMNEDGIMQTGWIKDNGSWYYMNPGGTMATGWVNDGGAWYYMNPDGTMATGWIQEGDQQYFLNENGIWEPDAALAE